MLTEAQRSRLIASLPHLHLMPEEQTAYEQALRALEVLDAPVLVFKRLAGAGWLLGARTHRKLPKGFGYAHEAISATVARLPPPNVPPGLSENGARTAIRSEAVNWALRHEHTEFAAVLRSVHVEHGCFVFKPLPSLPRIELK